MNGREPFGYVVAVEGAKVTLNLNDSHRGHLAGHREGVCSVTEIGCLFGVDAGHRLLLLRVRSLSFAEPKEAHRVGVGSTMMSSEPLRHLEAFVTGIISRQRGRLVFTPDSLASPALGAEAYPLSREELTCVLRSDGMSGQSVCLGQDQRGGGGLTVGLTDLLGRHVAVLGSTGQGKSCFTAAVLQQILKLPSPRVVLFDINGEYHDALRPHVADPSRIKHTALGAGEPRFRIPYYALGRHGLSRLLMPSEKTQRPALTFALEHLGFVKWFPAQKAAGLITDRTPVLFDDGRPGDASEAQAAIDQLRSGTARPASRWPHMGALACLVAESHSIQQMERRGQQFIERSSFQYSNIAPLVTRIRRLIDDPMFTSIVDVDGGAPVGRELDWQMEGGALVDAIFGGPSTRWKLHVVDLRNVAHDLMPLVLGSLLELLAFQLFRRGQNGTHPTLLVLEEAHHYLRQITDADDDGTRSRAYERLAKEGRKFGLGLWLSTQRPAEVSPTVLAQCGTWVVFRLASEADLRAVASAGEWVDRQELGRIAGLPRQQALVFGTSVSLPVRVTAPTADPVPNSTDPDFQRWAEDMPPLPEEEPAVTAAPVEVAALDEDEIPF